MSDTLKNFDWALAQLRHLYIQHNLNEGLKTGLLGPQIERLEEVRNDLHALTERLRAVEAERDEAKRETEAHDSCNDMFMAQARAQLSALRAELERKDAALKIYQARAHRNANSTCDGCPFAVAERDVNWADRAEGYYTCGLDNKERWGEDPACPDALYKEPPCKS